MKSYLVDYINRMKQPFSVIDEGGAHQIAFAFLTFKMGLYDDTVRRCEKSLEMLKSTKAPSALEKSLKVIQERARDLSQSRIQSTNIPLFSPEERHYTAINVPLEQVEDPIHLTISNSLLLLYAIAINMSPDDATALEEQERYVIHILDGYKKLLNIEE